MARSVKAVGELINEEPAGIWPIGNGPWMVVELKTKKKVKIITDQKVMFDQEKKELVMARPVMVKSDEMQFVEIRDVKSKEEFKELKEALRKNRGEVTSQSPAKGVWLLEYKVRIVWKIRGELTSWKAPAKITIQNGNTIRIANAPLW